MKNLSLVRNRKQQKGQSMAEYAIIISLIALVCIGAITAFGDKIKEVFQKSTTALEKGTDEVDDN